jgi:hypothetical protein
MDLEAANLSNARASRMTRAGMIACYFLAGAMLIASLAMAKVYAPAPDQSAATADIAD